MQTHAERPAKRQRPSEGWREEEVEDTSKSRHGQGHSEGQRQFAVVEPEGDDALLRD